MYLQHLYDFLRELKKNNNREWFKANKTKYLTAKKEAENFMQVLIGQIAQWEPETAYLTPAQTLFRIYRDTRFSKDKRPYKEAFCGFIAPGGRKSPLAGYYIHLEPGNTFAGGGVWHPPSPLLRKIREYIFRHPEAFKNIIENEDFKKYFGEIYGEKLKTFPRGFPKDFPYMDLLKYKSYALVHPLPDRPSVEETVKAFKKMRKFNEFINKALSQN